MREIKFRAWHKRENRMIYADEAKNAKTLWAVGFHGLPIAVDSDSFREDGVIGWNVDHYLALMQYTGIKDKNGKEIYEGDIIKFTWTQFGRDHRQIQKVEFDASMMLYPFQEFFDYDGKLWVDRAIFEVLGNVYEHPELLNRSKEA